MTTMQLRSEPVTDELLADVLDAHGGLENWNAVTELTAELSLGGPFWGARGWPDVYADQTVTLDPHREHITFAPFTAPDRISVLDVDPERVTIRTLDGEIVEERADAARDVPAALRRLHDAVGRDPGRVLRERCDVELPDRAVRVRLPGRPGARDRAVAGGRRDLAAARGHVPRDASPTTTPSRSSTTTSGSCSGAWTTRPT